MAILPSTNPGENSQLGIVITKKTCRTAAERNKLKRQIRDITRRQLLDGLPAGQKIVIMAFPFPAKRKFQDIKEELAELFKKAL